MNCVWNKRELPEQWKEPVYLYLFITRAIKLTVVHPVDGGRSSSGTSVSFSQTSRCTITQHNHVYTRRRENLKSNRLSVSENRVLRRIFGHERDEVKRYKRKVGEILNCIIYQTLLE
jgi:hypothetical protein